MPKIMILAIAIPLAFAGLILLMKLISAVFSGRMKCAAGPVGAIVLTGLCLGFVFLVVDRRSGGAISANSHSVVITEKAERLVIQGPEDALTIEVVEPKTGSSAPLIHGQWSKALPEGRSSPGLRWTVLVALAITAMMYLGYVFLDAGTRGQFTWPLRILSLMGIGIVIAVTSTLVRS